MKKILLAAAILLSIPAALQAKEKETVTLNHITGERITGVDVNGGFDVTLVYTPELARNGVVIEIAPELKPYLVLQRSDAGMVRINWNKERRDQLQKGLRGLFLQMKEPRTRVTICLGELTRVETSGSATVRGERVSGERLDIKCSGSGRIELAAEVTGAAKVSISGSGSVALSGSGQQASFDISGSGKIRAENFRVQKAAAHISGSGSVHLWAGESIEGSISGSGSVRYAGEPRNVRVKKSGSGSVRTL